MCAIGVVLLAAAIFASLLVGARMLTLDQLISAFDGTADTQIHALVWDYRIPRTLIAICVGASLAVAGGLVQALTRNPLGDPGILGVNAGAAFAVTLVIWLADMTATSQLIWAALVGAALTTLAVVAVGSSGRGPATPLRMTLAGVAIAAVLSGITSGLRLLDTRTFDQFRVWSSGSVVGRDLGDLLSVAPLMALGVIIALAVARPLNALGMGDDVAASLGTRVPRTRTLTVLGISLLAGSATAVAGPIGFVGLMVPHAVRWATGPDQRCILPLAILGGAVLLVVSDVVARVLLMGREIPVGVVTAFVGAPVLILLVRRKRVSTL